MSTTVYLFDPSVTNLKTHILTNGVASIGDNSYNITSTNILNINGNSRANGTFYSNFNNGKAILIPADTSVNRPPIGIPGYVRLNTTFNALEYYNSNSWYPINVVPNLTSISPTFLTVSNQDISLNGTNFFSGAIVTFIDGSNNQFPSPVTNFYNNNYVSAKTPATGLPASPNGYSVRITNPNGIPSTLYNVLFTTGTIYFITSPGSIGNIYALTPSGYSLLPVTAVDVNSNPLTYSIISGSLPNGLSLNSSTGAITGGYTGSIPASDTVYNFTIKAQNPLSVFATRAFSITVKTTVTTSFSTQGATAWTVPAGVLNVLATMWGAGGGAYYEGGTYPNTGSAGGAGGYTQTQFNIITSDSSTLTIIVGGGGNPNAGSSSDSYGGGGNAANGGSSGGGCSAILGGNITNPFIYQITTSSPKTYYTWVPQSNLLALAGATGVIAVAGGGGGASWYPSSDNNANGGCGGGLIGYSAVQGSSSSYATPGGTQSAGGSNSGADSSTSGSKFLGGYSTNNNGSTGGAGGGGSGWYGGGATQFLSGGDTNSGGGGGSGFIGYVNGSLSSVLIPTSGNNYSDSSTRINGQRKYTNSICSGTPTQSGTLGTTNPPNTANPNYQTGVGTGAPYGTEGGVFGGNGLVVLQY